MTNWGLSQLYNVGQLPKSISEIHQINKLKKRKHMIISKDAEKALDKIQHPFLIKVLNKLGIEENFFNLIKGAN